MPSASRARSGAKARSASSPAPATWPNSTSPKRPPRQSSPGPGHEIRPYPRAPAEAALDQMKRRELIAMLAATAATRWPPAAAQQGEAPLIGLLHLAPDDPTERFIPPFRRYMKEYGREEGHNLRLLVLSAEGSG